MIYKQKQFRMKKLVIFVFIILVSASWTPRPIEWVAIGDSITFLNDPPGGTTQRGYLTQVTEQLPNVRYINKGYNGWTSGSIADKIDELEIPRADVYSVFLGTNDWWSGRPIGVPDDYVRATGSGTVYGAYRIIIDKLRGLNGKAKIILITPLQRGDYVQGGRHANNAYGSYRDKNGQRLAQVADAVKHIAEQEKLTLVDLYYKSGITVKNVVKFKRLKDTKTGEYKNYPYPEYLNIPFNPDDEYPYPPEAVDMTFDGLHPSEKGNAVIAKMIVKTMKKLF
jgi:lysophospholipase L1-like esterase